MTPKPNPSAPSLKQRLERRLEPLRPVSRRRFRQLQKRFEAIEALNKRIDDLHAQLNQFITLFGMKHPLLPIPPKHLQVRIAGAYGPGFFTYGKTMFQDIETILQGQGLSIFQFQKILDFGCGCGRFLIPMSCLMDPKKLSGTDIDPEPIQWLRENYPCFCDLGVNDCNPPTKYPDGTFDFVYSVSIFTHLPEDMQHAWLKELSRIIKPGGWGIFTTHGENHFHHLPELERGQLLEKGFYYFARERTEGLPDFYQTTLHTHAYIRREWSRYFDVVDLRQKGMGQHQDTVLVRNRPSGSNAPPSPPPGPRPLSRSDTPQPPSFAPFPAGLGQQL